MLGVPVGRWEGKNGPGRGSSHSCKGPRAHVAGERAWERQRKPRAERTTQVATWGSFAFVLSVIGVFQRLKPGNIAYFATPRRAHLSPALTSQQQ